MKKIFGLIIALLMFAAPAHAHPFGYGGPGAPASETVAGTTERCTNAETVAGSATDCATTPANITAKMAAPGTTGATTPGQSYYLIPEVTGVADGAAFTSVQCSGTTINSYGRGAARTNTLPAAATGLGFVAVVGSQHNSAWKIQRAGSDTLIVDGNASKTYIQETNQAVGSRIACQAFQTGAAAWTWICSSVSGNWITD